MEVYSLFELNQYIKQVVALNFVDSMWISCEISQVSESRGHCYLTLVEKDEDSDQVKAMISAAIWYREYMFIRKKLGAIVDKVLQDGMQVKLKVEVDFHERFGIKLVVKDIDPSYTYGQLAVKREQIIEKLREEGRMDMNKSLDFPRVVQKIAVISSDTAAGFQDFIEHLGNNAYHYMFDCQIFSAAMQGSRTEMEVVSQLREIEKSGDYQIVVITRGGGSKLDLSGFDSYAISKEISEMSIPVVTGIGHDIDMSIADMVSAISLKTPTAVANFLIDHNAAFESSLYDLAIEIKVNVQSRFSAISEFLTKYQHSAENIIANRISLSRLNLDRLRAEIPQFGLQNLRSKSKQLETWANENSLLEPKRLLNRGYSITKSNGKVIDSAKKLKKGDKISTTFRDGETESIVN